MNNYLTISFLCISILFISCNKNVEFRQQATARAATSITQLNDVTSTFSDLVDFPVHIIVKENNSGKMYLTFWPLGTDYKSDFKFASKYTEADASSSGYSYEYLKSKQAYYLRIDPQGNLQFYRIIGAAGSGFMEARVSGIDKPSAWVGDTTLIVKDIDIVSEPVFPSEPLYSWRILSGATNHPGSYVLKNVGSNRLLGCSLTGDNIYASTAYSTGRQEFEIRPADEFEIVDIEYFNDAYATVSQQPDFITQWFYSNNTSIQQSMSTSFSQRATQTSSFSQTTGGSLTLSVNLNVKVPFFNGGIQTTVSANHSATYGKTETNEDAQTYNFPINVAPRTSVTATATVGRYLINMKYKATLRGINTGKLLTVDGTWEGISCTDVKVALVEKSLDTGETLRTSTLSKVPKTTFSF
ncbi:ETX/MTX2 family pore-forming toxin [Niabella sp.]|uniref:ETX/MTX2 family pore-forming toxin n=1 Tax=Niabella sp. TaxID=1962976 RepID=UPI0026206BE6|nr:ETX/MTX2 family pore-forming toxin [Niabella sp.]